jgi:UDP-glucuronate 4-epimerase
MRVLLTGAAGFIGFHLARHLLDVGLEVSGVDSLTGYYATGLKQDRLKLLQTHRNFSFSGIDLCHRSDVEALYAATKKANEVMAHSYSRQFGLQVIGLRFFSVYGPWGRPDMAYFSFTRKILAGESIPVFNQGQMVRDFTYIGDICQGISQLIKRLPDLPSYRIYNLGNNHPVKIMDFIASLESALSCRAQIDLQPMQTGDVTFTNADISLAQKDFAYAPKTSLQDGLSHFVDWYHSYYK